MRIKDSIIQEDLSITNMYAPKTEFKTHEGKIDMKGETDTSTLIVRDFVVSLSITNRTIPTKSVRTKMI